MIIFILKSIVLCLVSATAVGSFLSTSGNRIVSGDGNELVLQCTNWYGAHMENFVVNGLNAQKMSSIASTIKEMGFNCVRLPFSTELYYSNPTITNATVVAANTDLLGRSALEVFDLTIAALTSRGIMVVLNNHLGKAQWCCSETDGEGLWYSEAYPESALIESWTALASRYKSNSKVVGADLRNELRPANGVSPTWGDGNAATDWAAAATRVANAILAVNPGLLIMVESLAYSTDFSAAAAAPITLSVPNRLVWAPHDYSWSQSGVSTYQQFAALMTKRWGYLLTPGQAYTAPVWLGEFGTDISSDWWGWIRQYITEEGLSWSYWAVDGEKYVGQDETFGLLLQDYSTVRHDWKLADLQALMGKN